MWRWFALGAAVVGLTWGPYVYTELSRRVHSAAASAADEPDASSSESQLSAAKDDARPTDVVTPQPPQPSAAAVQQLAAAKPPEPPSPEPAHEPAPEPERPAPAHEASGATDALRHSFDDETRDAFWANDQELGLRSALQSLEIAVEAVSEVACRRTVCRVTFTPPQLESELETRVLARFEPDFSAAAFERHDSESDRHAALFLRRAGYK